MRGGPIPILYTASNVSHGMTAWGLGENTGAQFIEKIEYNKWQGTAGLKQLTIADVNGQDVLLPSGQDDDRMAFHRLSTDGSFDGLKVLGASPSQIGAFTNTEVIQLAERPLWWPVRRG